MPTEWKNVGNPLHPPDAVLVEKHDYDGGDPSLEIVQAPDGLYDLVIYKGKHDLTVPGLSADQVRLAATRILELVPDVR